jgi:magnesium chelatase subunit H
MHADVQPLRVVVVTMDSHMAGAIGRVETELKRELPGLSVTIHTADEWGNDPALLAECRADIAGGDIVVATMLFLDDHIQDVLPALRARRDHCDAMLCCVSASEIVKLTKLGRVDMTVESTGALALLKRMRGSRKKHAGSSGEKQMRMLRRLPKLMRFIPGAAQDLRVYFLAMQYWLAGSDQNLANMIRLLAERYAAGPRQIAPGSLQHAAPVEYPDVGLYHPDLPGRITSSLAELPDRSDPPCVGTVGLLLMRSYVLAGNAAHYDGMIAALEARGMRVIPAFASGLDQRPAVNAYFLRNGAPAVDVVLSLTGFSLVGGPAYNDARAAQEMLAGLDVPYVAAGSVEFQTIEQWRDDPRGLTPVEATMMVAIPELDGGIMPTFIGGKSSTATGDHRRDMVANLERAGRLAARIERLIRLRRSARAERRVAIVLFNFPPNAGSTGTAAYLDVFASLHNTLASLRDEGYCVGDLPSDSVALREAVTIGNSALYGALANVAARIPAEVHVREERYLHDIERQWGPAPGRQQSDGANIFVLGVQFGNVFVGVQPAFGYEGDPMRLLFEASFAPTHAFSAFYRWIDRDFGAHAVLHFGTHGALEFMPGKQVGMSETCWPDRLIGDLPNFYYYASNNPSEGMLAKRRANATLISYLTPPVSNAGLYRGLADLKSSLDRFRALDPVGEAEAAAQLATLVQAQAASVDLAEAEPQWGAEAQVHVERLTAAILELEYTLIPHGLHVIGAPPNQVARCEMLDAAGITDPARRAELDALLAQDHELPALIHALDGGYVRPAPGGDFLRTPEIVPTGRNLHGFDPFLIPSAFAVQDGARQADRLLARHAEDGNGLPETVALVLWGTDNLKTEGGPIAQVLWLLGCAPDHDGYGRLIGPKLIPLAELGRPRIDVVVSLSGIFRDLLPLQTKLLAQAALMAAEADEPLEMNAVRRHALAFQIEHGGTLADAALRVFGNTDSAYGANVNQLLESGAWNDEDELAEAYVKRKGFAYGVDGRPHRHDALLAQVLSHVDVAYQNLDSIELGVTTVDHYFDTLGGISRAIQRQRGKPAAVYIGDQTRGTGQVRSIAEQVALETRTRALNPKWYEALLAHGFEGVRQIEAQVTNTLGWSATTGQVAPWVYQQLTQTFMLDEEMRTRLAKLNPTSSARIANRLIEASERNYWSPSESVLNALRHAGDELEDYIEGIPMGAAA